jgi:hypothetical protein
MRTRPIAAFVLAAMLPQLGACTSWRVQPLTPAQALRDSRPRDVRVRLRHDSSAVVIPEAQIIGDSIVGYKEPGTLRFTPQRIAVPLADVRDVAVRKVDAGRTVLASVFAVGLLGLTTWGIVAAIRGIDINPLGGMHFTL